MRGQTARCCRATWRGQEGDGPYPGVIVLQEWWGIDEHVKDIRGG